MNTKRSLLYAAFYVVVAMTGWSMAADTVDVASLSRMPERNSSAPYNGEERIVKALQIARQTGKLVLIQSACDGCTWCHLMHKILTTDQKIIAKIQSDYVYVLVDTTNDRNRNFSKKYADNTDHALVLIVMNADGKQLVRKIGGQCVEGDPAHYHISPDTMLKFLESSSLKQ